MNKLVTLVLIVAMALPWGCSYPDDENWTALREGVGELPPATLLQSRRWTASENAYHRLSRHSRDADLLRVMCVDSSIPMTDTIDAGAGDIVYSTFTVADMIACIVDVGERRIVTFADCVKILTDAARDRAQTRLGGTWDCAPNLLAPFDDLAREPDLDPDQIADEDILEMFVQSDDIPPEWLWTALGATVVVVGGVIVSVYFPPVAGALAKLAPALCALRAQGGRPCPSSPLLPPGQTPQPPEGDR